jgi:hypothetical protein
MSEGNQGDTTRVKFLLTSGSLVRVFFFFKSIGKVAELVSR